jgi:hypothetical protein
MEEDMGDPRNPDPNHLKLHAPNLAEVFTTGTNALAVAALRCIMTPGDPGLVIRATLLPHLQHIKKLAEESIDLIERVAPASPSPGESDV